MGKTLNRLLLLAEGEIGYTEKDNDKDLNTKVGSTAGDGNHTKYARDLTAMGLSGYCGSAWCAVYQMWLIVMIVGLEQARKYMGPQFYNCFAVRDYAKSKSRWLPASATPAAGYLVIFKQSHIALVTKVTAAKIYTNEGNTSNGTAVVRNGGMVCAKSYDRGNSNIMGYVVMEYPDAAERKEGFLPAADGQRWWYQFKDGSYAHSKWYWLTEATTKSAAWYLFNSAGYMLTGYQTAPDGRKYLLCPDKGVNEGKCMVTDDQGALRLAEYDQINKRYKI